MLNRCGMATDDAQLHEVEATAVQLDAIDARRQRHFVMPLGAKPVRPHDILYLRERDPGTRGWTRNALYVRVLCVEEHPPGLCVCSIEYRDVSTGRYPAAKP